MQISRTWWGVFACALVACGADTVAPPGGAAGNSGDAEAGATGGGSGQTNATGGCGGVDMAVTQCECHQRYPDASELSGSELACCLVSRNGPAWSCTEDNLGTPRCPGSLPEMGTPCGWSATSASSASALSCDSDDAGLPHCAYAGDGGQRTLVTCVNARWQSLTCEREAGTPHDASVVEADAPRHCAPIQVCTGACVEGRRNTTEVVDGCTVSRCCALTDGGSHDQ